MYADVWVSMGDEATAAERRAKLARYRVDDALLDEAAPGAFAMHDLPAHAGEEISAEVLYGRRQRIWDQAENRRHAQKALLELLAASRHARRTPRRRARTSTRAATAAPARRAGVMSAQPRTASSRDEDSLANEQPAKPRPGDELELEVESLAFGGEGVARLGDQGYVVFVAGAIPGDRVRATVSRRKRSYARAYATAILRASPERIAPRADHPGVAWQVLPYERQLEIKRGQVDEALRRLGHLDGFELEEIVPALAQWRYRNKLEYSFGTDQQGALVCGFHAPGGWKEVVPMRTACSPPSSATARARSCSAGVASRAWDRGPGADAAPAVRSTDAAARRTRAAAQPDRARRPQDRPEAAGQTGHDRRRRSTPDALALALRDALGEHLSGVLWTRSRSLAETTAGGDTDLVWGEEQLPERLGELELRISPQAFFQTNTEMAELLYGVIGEYAALQGWERVYDLYCGIGTIALTLAPRAAELWGIELVEQAVADAIATARAQRGDERALLRRRRAPGAGGARRGAPGARTCSWSILRARGSRAKSCGASSRLRRNGSCTSPATRRRSRRTRPSSCEAGWRLERVRPVDMFPQTHHVECVALLERA